MSSEFKTLQFQLPNNKIKKIRIYTDLSIESLKKFILKKLNIQYDKTITEHNILCDFSLSTQENSDRNNTMYNILLNDESYSLFDLFNKDILQNNSIIHLKIHLDNSKKDVSWLTKSVGVVHKPSQNGFSSVPFGGGFSAFASGFIGNMSSSFNPYSNNSSSEIYQMEENSGLVYDWESNSNCEDDDLIIW
jgi:hypothetical protein